MYLTKHCLGDKAMKIERSTDCYGSGGGREIFESENFRVTHWKKIKGLQTEIRCKLDNSKIKFNGIFDFKSDDECMEQFNADEIMKMIQRQKEISFKAGMDYKAKEIRNCLGIQEIRFEDED
jgi:hypothetical protein